MLPCWPRRILFLHLLTTFDAITLPTTASPGPGDYIEAYKDLAASGAEEIISIHMTSKASGAYQAACVAQSMMEEQMPGLHIEVIDTRNASAGQGLVAMYAAECADAGMDATAITSAVQAVLPRTRTFAYLPTLDYGVRGGRVPAIARTFANLLRLSPLLAISNDGHVGIGGALFGRRDRVAKFIRFIGRRIVAGRRYRLIVGHGDAADAGRRLLEALTTRHPGIERSWLVPCGAALGVHGGPGFLVVGLQEYDQPLPPAAS